MRAVETFPDGHRNHERSAGIRPGVGGAAGLCEGPAAGPTLRGSGPGITTPRRGSDPGPPTRDPGRAPAARVCARCRKPGPRAAFPLATDPKARRYATRKWCERCLIDGGHITPTQAANHRAQVANAMLGEEGKRVARAAEAERRRQENRARTERVNAHRRDLAARARRDPEFARALVAAADLKQVQRAAERLTTAKR